MREQTHRLLLAMETANIQPKALADKTGYSIQAISGWKNGRKFGVRVARKLAKSLKCSPMYLLCETENPQGGNIPLKDMTIGEFKKKQRRFLYNINIGLPEKSKELVKDFFKEKSTKGFIEYLKRGPYLDVIEDPFLQPKRLKSLVKNRKVPIAEIANGTGYSKDQIKDWMEYENFGIDTAIVLGQFLKVHPLYLLCQQDDPKLEIISGDWSKGFYTHKPDDPSIKFEFLPILGEIPAGNPAEIEVDDAKLFPIKGEDYKPSRYVLRVNGESMEPTIGNQSLVLMEDLETHLVLPARTEGDVKKRPADHKKISNLPKGIYAFFVNGEPTLKRFRVEVSGKEWILYLYGDNALYPPKEISPSDEVRVSAKAIKILEGML